MNMRLFISTFALIFLAELGDKTQLAAMARVATGDGGKWTVFLSASSALVLSTLVAVMFGSALNKVVPAHYIKTAAGILFIVFGLIILGNVLMPGRLMGAWGRPGMASHVALRMAATFEQASVDDYRQLAEAATDPREKAALQALTRQEAEHLKKIRRAELDFEDVKLRHVRAGKLPAETELSPDVAAGAGPLLRHAMEHEQATACFYEELARDATLPGLRRTFLALADEERKHIQHLKDAFEAS